MYEPPLAAIFRSHPSSSTNYLRTYKWPWHAARSQFSMPSAQSPFPTYNCLHQNLEGESQGPRSSQDRIIKGSVAGGSEIANSDAKSRNQLSSDSASR